MLGPTISQTMQERKTIGRTLLRIAERRLVQERPTISRMLLKIAVQFRAPVRLAINRMLRRTGPTLQRTVLKTAATRTSQIGTYHVRLRPTRRDKDNRGSSRVSIL